MLELGQQSRHRLISHIPSRALLQMFTNVDERSMRCSWPMGKDTIAPLCDVIKPCMLPQPLKLISPNLHTCIPNKARLEGVRGYAAPGPGSVTGAQNCVKNEKLVKRKKK